MAKTEVIQQDLAKFTCCFANTLYIDLIFKLLYNIKVKFCKGEQRYENIY